jgi:hypothetical protein
MSSGSRSARLITSRTASVPSSTAVMSLYSLPDRMNGVLHPVTIATRLPFMQPRLAPLRFSAQAGRQLA